MVDVHVRRLDAACELVTRVEAEIGVGEEPEPGGEPDPQARADARAGIGGVGDVERGDVDAAAGFDERPGRRLDILRLSGGRESEPGEAGEQRRRVSLYTAHD